MRDLARRVQCDTAPLIEMDSLAFSANRIANTTKFDGANRGARQQGREQKVVARTYNELLVAFDGDILHQTERGKTRAEYEEFETRQGHAKIPMQPAALIANIRFFHKMQRRV